MLCGDPVPCSQRWPFPTPTAMLGSPGVQLVTTPSLALPLPVTPILRQPLKGALFFVQPPDKSPSVQKAELGGGGTPNWDMGGLHRPKPEGMPKEEEEVWEERGCRRGLHFPQGGLDGTRQLSPATPSPTPVRSSNQGPFQAPGIWLPAPLDRAWFKKL